MNCLFVVLGLRADSPRPPLPPLPTFGWLQSESFDQPYGQASVVPVDRTVWTESWSGWALVRQGESVTPWVVPVVVSNRLTVDSVCGAIRLWYRPDFDSGSGPGHSARLLTLATGRGKSALVWWALVVTPDGKRVELVCEGEKGTEICLSAEVDWFAGGWHLLTLGYSPGNSVLFVDDQAVAWGTGVAAVPNELQSVSSLIVGSGLAGEEPAEGQIEELTTLTGRKRFQRVWDVMEFGLSAEWDVAQYFTGLSSFAALGPISEAEEQALAALRAQRKTEREVAAQLAEESGGMQFLVLSSSNNCVTGGPWYLTNIVTTLETNNTVTVRFDIAGGTNEVPVDIFTATNLIGNDVTNAVWTWLEQGYTCETHEFMNQPNTESYYILTTPGADRDGDGLYDGWEWKHFGTLAEEAGGDYDGDGVSNGAEYANGTDPNSLSFSAHVGYGRVATTSPAADVEVLSGVPAYIAVMVDTNMALAADPFPYAQWQPYTASPTIPLPAVEGLHRVWIGLRGRAADSRAAWFGFRVVLDQTPPPVVITEPFGPAIDKPFVQVRGYAADRLWSVSCTLTNALGVRSNFSAFISGEDATNRYFKCLDVPLTNGLNTITVFVADTAGNLATTNLDLTYDPEADTNAPALSVFWPPDGAQVAATNFTVRGAVDDETATVMARIVSGGLTNVVRGMVERNGRLWVDYLPLAAGTNTLTLTVTDAAGNVNVTNLTVVKSSVLITMNEVQPEQLKQPTVDVSGTISDGGYKVWVNGVAATETNGIWSAPDVPVTPGGSAVFAVTAIPISDNNGNGTPGSGAGPDPAALNPTSASALGGGMQPEKDPEVVRTYGHWERNLWVATRSGLAATGNLEAEWTRTETNGTGTMTLVNENISGTYVSGMFYSRTQTDHLLQQWEDTPGNIVSTSTNFSMDTDTATAFVAVGYTTVFELMTSWLQGSLEMAEVTEDIAVDDYEAAQTRVLLRTGGRSGVNRQSLFVVSGSAWDRTKYGSPMIPQPEIFVPGIGKSLGADGLAYAVLADNDEVLLTPETPAAYFRFTIGATKHRLRIMANNQDCQSELFFFRPTFIVGQYVTFRGVWDQAPAFGGAPPDILDYLTVNKWTFGGNYFNAGTNAVAGLSFPTCSINYFVNGSMLDQDPTTAWWVSGGYPIPSGYEVNLDKKLTFGNGQYVELKEIGTFQMYRPDATISPWPTRVGAYNLPGEGWQLTFYDYAPPQSKHGISFSNSISIPIGFSGQRQWVQVNFNPARTLTEYNGTTHTRFYNGPWPYSDPVPYPHFIGDAPVDDPGLPLRFDCVRGEAADSFRLWMMFKPDLPGEWVPLRAVNWSWSGTATNEPAAWTLISDPHDYDVGSVEDTEQYPLWRSPLSDSQWQPPFQ